MKDEKGTYFVVEGRKVYVPEFPAIGKVKCVDCGVEFYTTMKVVRCVDHVKRDLVCNALMNMGNN